MHWVGGKNGPVQQADMAYVYGPNRLFCKPRILPNQALTHNEPRLFSALLNLYISKACASCFQACSFLAKGEDCCPNFALLRRRSVSAIDHSQVLFQGD